MNPMCGEHAAGGDCAAGLDLFGTCLVLHALDGADRWAGGSSWDANGDGLADLVQADDDDLGAIVRHQTDSAPLTFEPSPIALPGGSQVGKVHGWAAADLTGDGAPEFLLCGSAGQLVYSFEGGGATGAPVSLQGCRHDQFELVDLDGDDLPEFVASVPDLCVSQGLGDGSFGPSNCVETGLGNAEYHLEIADYDGDGAIEAALLATPNDESFGGSFALYRFSGLVPARIDTPAPEGRFVALATRRVDGASPQLAMVGYTDQGPGEIAIFELNSELWERVSQGCTDPQPNVLRALDLDGDGSDELVAYPYPADGSHVHNVVGDSVEALWVPQLAEPFAAYLDADSSAEIVTGDGWWGPQ